MFKKAAGQNSDEMLAYLFGPINFFKHADRDPDALLVFDDMRNEDLVFSVVLDFLNISGQQPIEVQVFYAWYCWTHPEHLSIPDMCDAAETMRLHYPDPSILDRAKQKGVARDLLLMAVQDPEILNHPLTDLSETSAI